MSLGLSMSTAGIVNPGVAIHSNHHISPGHFPSGEHTITPYSASPAGPMDPKDVAFLKGKVTPDEIIMGVRVELKKMLNADKAKAMELVVTNLKRDPKYYSSLNMLIKSDERLNETVEEKDLVKKKAFQEIFSELTDRQSKAINRVVDPRVVEAYRESVGVETSRVTDPRVIEAYRESVDTFNRRRQRS